MKLKRFLLRYEPPGIGLELEDATTGDTNIKHKDMPAAEEVIASKSPAVKIQGLVDDLINGESDLLTKRRHRAALLQLLGRLYQVDATEAGAEEDEDKGGTSTARSGKGADHPEPEEDGALQEGQQIVLIGLKGKLQQYNGELAVIVDINAAKQKYHVDVHQPGAESRGTVKVKGKEHLVPVAPKGTPLRVGEHVVIRGLRNHVELNGCLGRVVECHEENHRFEVRATESGQLFRVKQENLVPIDTSACPQVTNASKENREPNVNASPRSNKGADGREGAAGGQQFPLTGDGIEEVFEVGSQVQLQGLKTAMCYNGQNAQVLSVDRARCRYEIRLNDGSVKTIRAENVKLIAPPDTNNNSKSPRIRRPKDPMATSGGKPADRGK